MIKRIIVTTLDGDEYDIDLTDHVVYLARNSWESKSHLDCNGCDLEVRTCDNCKTGFLHSARHWTGDESAVDIYVCDRCGDETIE